ncbi:MAG TPA: tRNA uracil 4-sulfurtransferase ThiI [Methanomicrobiales archaeon]|nr:tRNA uracil 4-sulfurtransferase ThiI [Methanomicrobiales archaeon]
MQPTDLWLVRYGEIFLKSDYVRRQWEKVLVRNIREQLSDCRVRSERGRVWVDGPADPEVLRRVFGIVSFSPVVRCTLGDLGGALVSLARERGAGERGTFAIRMRRVGTHPFTSREKAVELGDLVRASFPNLSVDLDRPDLELHVEIRGEACYLFTDVIPGAGGLPLGVEGTLVALVSGGIDSPVAAWMMMKRGCRIVPVYVALEGILGDDALARTREVVEVLRLYQPDIRLRVVSDSFLACAREQLARERLERFTCLICKRRMYRIAEEVAREEGAKGIVTGESLGQVASQTLGNLLVLDDAASLPVYRPLIGLDKEEITRIARGIGTFGPSTGQAEGCRAVPEKPATAADPEKIREIENGLQCDDAIHLEVM